MLIIGSYARRWLLLLAKGFQNNELDNQQNVLKLNCVLIEHNFRICYSCPFCLKKEWLRVQKVKPSKDLLEKQNQLPKKNLQINGFQKKLDGLEQLEKWDGAYYS
jgi:peptidyl-dipeptidase Dcp